MNSDIQGNLETTRCSEIVRILSLGKRAGRLFLTSGNETGSIYISEGRVIHAKCGNIEGVKAVYEMAAWSSGTYKFFIDEPTDLITINQTTDDILKEADNRIRQMEKIASLIPSAETVFMFDTEVKEKEIILKTIQWKVLSYINGERKISQIAQILGITDSDAMKVFYTLIRQGLIKESEQAEGSASKQAAELPETPYVLALAKNLTAAIGPIAPYIIFETASDTGLDIETDDIVKRAQFIEYLHNKIPDETIALRFLDNMAAWLKTGGGES